MAYGARRTTPLGVPVDVPAILKRLFLKQTVAAVELGPDLVERRPVDAPMPSPIPISQLQVPNFASPRPSSPQTGVGR